MLIVLSTFLRFLLLSHCYNVESVHTIPCQYFIVFNKKNFPLNKSEKKKRYENKLNKAENKHHNKH